MRNQGETMFQKDVIQTFGLWEDILSRFDPDMNLTDHTVALSVYFLAIKTPIWLSI